MLPFAKSTYEFLHVIQIMLYLYHAYALNVSFKAIFVFQLIRNEMKVSDKKCPYIVNKTIYNNVRSLPTSNAS